MGLADTRTSWTDGNGIVPLLEAARRFGSTLDESRIYAALQELVAASMPLDGLVVSSFDSAASLIRAEYIWSDGATVDPASFPPIEWRPDRPGMQSQVIQTGKSAIFDIGRKIREAETTYVQITPEGGPEPVVDEPEAKTAIMAPMILEGHVTGVVQVMCDRADAYSTEDLRLLEAVVLQMTAAWHHARLNRKAQEDRRLIDRVVSTSPDIIYIFDLRAHKIVFSNGQLERQLGYTEEDIANMHAKSLLEAMHPDDAVRLPQLLARYQHARDTDVFEAEWRLASKDGGWRWLLNRARVFERDPEGSATAILGYATDITEKKEKEAQQREAEERYRFLTEKGMSMVWTARPDGTIDYVNGRWIEYFGAGIEEGTASNPVERAHPQDLDTCFQRWQGAVEAGTEFECEVRLRRHDGEYRWHLCRAASMRDDDGKVERWFGVLIDIHDQKGIEEQLGRRVAQRTAELEAAVKELEGFTYSVSHDLRGPLRAISAAGMIIREDFGAQLPQEGHSLLQRQSESVKKMGTLIDDLLKLSRLGRQELTPAWFDLSALSHEVSDELGAGDRMQIEADLKAFGDPRLVRFVILNLVENAIKFSPQGGEIVIGRKDDGFFVADSGIGFDMEYASKIFRPFERLVRDDEYPGTGIGLANTQRIVQRHGGRVWAESTPGRGSTFYFTLPGPGESGR